MMPTLSFPAASYMHSILLGFLQSMPLRDRDRILQFASAVTDIMAYFFQAVPEHTSRHLRQVLFRGI